MELAKTKIRQNLRKRAWNANKRTVESQLISTLVLDQVKELHRSGCYEEAINLLDRQPSDYLITDARALIVKSVILLGLGNDTDAVDILMKADQAWTRERTKIWGNLSLIYLRRGEYDKAIDSSLLAISCHPTFFAPHLNLIASYAGRGSTDDIIALEGAVANMRKNCADLNKDPSFWTYLLTDIDFAKVRSLSNFKELFGDIPDDLLYGD